MRLRKSLIVIMPLVLGLMAIFGSVALAQEGGGDDGKTNLDARCLNCHSDSDATVTFEDGEERSVHFDIQAFNLSVHGAINPPGYLSCFDCHGDYRFPHEDNPDVSPRESAREFQLSLNQQCERCHDHQTELNNNGVHTTAITEDDAEAVVCIDCHGSHEVQIPDIPRAALSLTCGDCHDDIMTDYQDSVHGASLLEEANPDVPTCVECHGVHAIEDPTTNIFRTGSPELCADCHADEDLMGQYEISTDVFNTYLADFHGTTVTLFDHQAPETEVNKAVCYDCHGVHDIRASDDPESSVIRENLLETCQKCHPDATASFPASWTSHHEPSPDKNPWVYYVNLFYMVFIPGVLGGLVVVISTDVVRRIRNLFSRNKSS